MTHILEDLIDRIGRFEQSLRLVRYWAAKASESPAGEFPDLDPVDIPQLLPFLYLLERDGDRLRYRVSGDNVNHLFGSEYTRRYFDEVVPLASYQVVSPYFFRVLDGYCCVFKGFLTQPEGDLLEFERILVPVFRKNRRLILGCASFSATGNIRRLAPEPPGPGFHFHVVDLKTGAVEESWVDILPHVDRAVAGGRPAAS